MRFGSAAIALLMAMCLLITILIIATTACSAQSAPDFQSVSGEFARNWINSSRARIPSLCRKALAMAVTYGTGAEPPGEAR